MNSPLLPDRGAVIFDAVERCFQRSVAPLLKRIADLEAKLGTPAPAAIASILVDRRGALVVTKTDGTTDDLGVVVGKDGAGVDMAVVGQSVRDEVAKAVAPMLEAQGDDQTEPVTEAFVAPIVEKAVERAIAAAPKPQDGKSVDPAAVKAMIAEAVGEAVAALPPAKDGQSVTLDQARPVIEAAVKEAAAALPKPENGKDADQDAILVAVMAKAEAMVAEIDVTTAVKAAVSEAIAALPAPKDGIGLAGAVIDREGSLVVTMTNGEAKGLGPVVGKDADMASLVTAIREEVAKIPAPADGADGINWDDLSVIHDGARTVTFRYQRGDKVKEFEVSFPAIIYRGVFDNGGAYTKGDMVTWDGSLWHCNAEETKSRPNSGDASWILAAKKGRDGKDFDRPAHPRDPRIKS